MTRASIVTTLLAVLVLAGCTSSRPANSRWPGEGRSARNSTLYRRVEPDTRSYVRLLDQHLNLSGSQERNVRRLLQNRTVNLLDRTRAGDRTRVYPFPRRDEDRQNGAVRNWWDNVDRDIARTLSRRQAAAYRDLVARRFDDYDGYDRNRRYDGRGRYDTPRADTRGRRDDRYDNGRSDNGRHNGWYKNGKAEKTGDWKDERDDD